MVKAPPGPPPRPPLGATLTAAAAALAPTLCKLAHHRFAEPVKGVIIPTSVFLTNKVRPAWSLAGPTHDVVGSISMPPASHARA
jgi:hypothetical protein